MAILSYLRIFNAYTMTGRWVWEADDYPYLEIVYRYIRIVGYQGENRHCSIATMTGRGCNKHRAYHNAIW